MINFTKMHGLGNDFVVIDAINQAVNLSPEQIRFLADRHFGIGFDQLLLIEKPEKPDADFKYRIFNADGGEVAQCGNGARCFARFVNEKNLFTGNEIAVDTNNGRLVLKINKDNTVSVNMGVPEFNPAKIPLAAELESDSYSVTVNGQTIHFGAVSMGNPHAVIKVDDAAAAPVQEFGRLLENHALFPERANIGFMQILDRMRIKLRVFERGAGETLACGSGACAAVSVGIRQHLLDSLVTVELTGGSLVISWEGGNQPLWMTGPAATVFEGEVSL
jgi:diaminopimelate epimerase